MIGQPGGAGAGGRLRGFLAVRLLQPAQAFVRTEAAGGALLLAATALALAWANSPWSDSYADFWHSRITIETARFSFDEDLRHLVNDGLMAIFFFVIGLEIKRELLHGELASRRRAAFPVAAAAGGMAVPALIYTAFNLGGDGAAGWAIPTATDIAFALGVLALLGNRVPFALKVFVLALAVVDDLGAILVIALFYTDSLSPEAALTAAGLLAVIAAVGRLGVRNLGVFAILGFGFWLAVLESGVHATIAGVVLALLTPSRARTSEGAFDAEGHAMLEGLPEARREGKEAVQTSLIAFEGALVRAEAPLDRLERVLHPWASYAIAPVFALANAGLDLSGGALSAASTSAVSAGILFGLVVGKPAGILLASVVAVRAGLASLPAGVQWRQIAGASLLAGIGFTVSLFITSIAFQDAALESEAKAGILAASLVAGVCGYAVLRMDAGRAGV